MRGREHNPERAAELEAKKKRAVSAWQAGELGVTRIAAAFSLHDTVVRAAIEQALAEGRCTRLLPPRRAGPSPMKADVRGMTYGAAGGSPGQRR